MLVLLSLCLAIFSNGEWVPEMENPNLFEGDIVLRPDEFGYASIIGGRWPHGSIPYQIESSVSPGVRAEIPKAIAEYEKHTCIRFRKRTTESAYISFYGGGGCSSPVGYSGRVNKVSLASGCRRLGTVMHEIGHSIGIYHEQSRPDRDNYVEILFQNIQGGMAYNFNKQSTGRIDSLGTPYDYLSMMHYGKTAFGGGRTTIRTKDPTFQNKIGNRVGFSKIDIVQINRMYCKGVQPTNPPICTDKPGKPCQSWVKAGYCPKYSSVRRDCCKSCKESIQPTSPPACADKPGKPCQSWAKAGYCKYSSVKRDCCKTCKESIQPTSPPACADKPGKPCQSWAKAGYCKYSSVKRDCCKTCKVANDD